MTSRATRSISRPSSRPAPRTSTAPEAARARARGARPARTTFASSASSTVSTTAHAAAHATGLPPNVLAWSPGSNASGALVGDEQRADRQPVREPLRERHGVRLHAEPLPREERAGPPHAGLHLVEDEQRAVLVGERRARARGTRGCAGWMPPSPCTGSRRMHAVSSSTAAASDAESFSFANATPGTQRLERRALRGLAGHRERAERAAVERVLERDDARSCRSPCART